VRAGPPGSITGCTSDQIRVLRKYTQ
jgi:hypothetical protein